MFAPLDLRGVDGDLAVRGPNRTTVSNATVATGRAVTSADAGPGSARTRAANATRATHATRREVARQLRCRADRDVPSFGCDRTTRTRRTARRGTRVTADALARTALAALGTRTAKCLVGTEELRAGINDDVALGVVHATTLGARRGPSSATGTARSLGTCTRSCTVATDTTGTGLSHVRVERCCAVDRHDASPGVHTTTLSHGTGATGTAVARASRSTRCGTTIPASPTSPAERLVRGDRAGTGDRDVAGLDVGTATLTSTRCPASATVAADSLGDVPWGSTGTRCTSHAALCDVQAELRARR